MPLLERGEPVADRFVAVTDDAPLPSDAPALIPLARLQHDAAALAGRNAELGVEVGSATRPEDIAPFLDRVSLVVVEFPKFRDGRGFTIARTLRERYGFAGELRAVGHILPDQYEFLVRCGFTSVVAPEGTDLSVWREALGRFHVAYQAGVDATSAISGLRRRLGQAGAAG
jgi:uncharacterized protein (DUF934 family)